MQVTTEVAEDRLHVEVRPTPTEAPSVPRSGFTVWTGRGWSLDDLHPDLLALAMILVCRPAADGHLDLPRGVSSAFAGAVEHLAGLRLTPVDDALAPRPVPTDGVPGLCFSGGVDSVAALSVLPATARSYFLERRVPAATAARLLTPEAGLSSVAGVRDLGREVRVVPTDLEYLRDPPGFPEHYANAVPALLHADTDRLSTIAWGLVLESAYRIGRARFVDYLDRAYNRRWHGVFAAAGLPMCNPVMGVSEVGTTLLASQGPYAALAQSCVRGPLGSPCNACVKCFRKQLIGAATSGRWPGDASLRALLRAYPVRSYLASVPLHQPAGLLWSLQRYPGQDPILLAVRDRLEWAEQDVGFVPRWYPAAQQHWPQVAWTEEVVAALDDRLGRMSEAEQAALRGFDLATSQEAPAVVAYAEATALLADRRVALDGNPHAKPASKVVIDGVPRELHDALEQQLVAAERRAAELRTSTSYRLGHALVRPLGRLLRGS